LESEAEYVFYYDNRCFDVPKDFTFGKATLREAMNYWFNGKATTVKSNRGNRRKRIRPFKVIRKKFLPSMALVHSHNLHWVRLFQFLKKGVPNEPPLGRASEKELTAYYHSCIAYLKTRVAYCFQPHHNDRALKYSVSTWSTRLARSSILKNGTEADKNQLGEPTMRNKPRANASGKPLKRKGSLKLKPTNPRLQRKRLVKLNRTHNDTDRASSVAASGATKAARTAAVAIATGATATAATIADRTNNTDSTESKNTNSSHDRGSEKHEIRRS